MRFLHSEIIIFCCSFKREDSEIDNTGNEDSDDSGGAEEYQSKSKKPINKGRWSKEEVGTLFTKRQIDKKYDLV